MLVRILHSLHRDKGLKYYTV